MKIKKLIFSSCAVVLVVFLIFAAIVLLLRQEAHTSFSNIETVTVGNPGNAPDPDSGYGKVDYTYAIGKYDVTLTQYTVFLNAVAKTDTYRLYNTNLGTDAHVAGIARTGTSGSYSYSVIGDGERPVTYVSWSDAARFCNWLHNGRKTGAQDATTTETGAYALNGAIDRTDFTKNADAQWWIPSLNEWYKAAYYDPNRVCSGMGEYWRYATRSDDMPGNEVGGLPNQTNHRNPHNSAYSVTQRSDLNRYENYLTPVGAFTNSASTYGTYDQDGNVYNWNDEVIWSYALWNSCRGVYGGSWCNRSALSSNYNFHLDEHHYLDTDIQSTFESEEVGFRVAKHP